MPVQRQLIQQAFVFGFDPTPRQVRAFRSHAGAARFAFNWGVATTAAALDARAAQKAAGAQPDVRVPNHFALCKLWTAHKDDPENGLGWVGENFVGTYQAALRDAAVAWQRFFTSLKTSGGRRTGRPRFKSKGKARESFQVHGPTLQLVGAKHVKLPRIGTVHVHESTAKLGRRLRRGSVTCPACSGTGTDRGADGGAERKCSTCKATGQVPQARLVRGTVSRDSKDRWSIALTVEVVREIRTGPSARQRAGGTVGIDLGVRDLAVLSDGVVVPNPRPLESGLEQLRAAQRALSRRVSGSQRHAKQKAQVGRLHARVRHLRLDALHKTTSDLVHRYARIGVEDWDVQRTAHSGSAGLPAKLRADRNRALADTGIGLARWQLKAKAAWYGATVVAADRHAPTGRTCSACGTARAKPIPPATEDFSCPSCGYRAPRRLNTARVLARFTARHTDDDPSGGESLNARGGSVRPVPRQRAGQPPTKRVARTRPSNGRDKTGTPGT